MIAESGQFPITAVGVADGAGVGAVITGADGVVDAVADGVGVAAAVTLAGLLPPAPTQDLATSSTTIAAINNSPRRRQ